MQPPINGVRGLFKIDGLPDLACKEINSFADAIKALPDFAVVELPASFNSTIVGAQAPSADDTNKIWYRFDLSGNFIGIYAFQAGAWELVVQPAPAGTIDIHWRYGPSNVTYNGWTLIDTAGPAIIDATVRTALVAQYVQDVTLTYYIYAAYIFTGYT